MVKISDAELEVMKILWEKKEVTSGLVIKELKDFPWNHNTIRTLINRLIAKKAIGISQKNGKIYTYVPLINEDEYKLKRSKSFIKQFYNGSINKMLLNFVDSNELTKSDIESLLDVIDKKVK